MANKLIQYSALHQPVKHTADETITIDKWLPNQPDVVRRGPMLLTFGMAFRAAAEPIDVKWFQPTGIPRFDKIRNQHLYPAFNINIDPLVPLEEITSTKWRPIIPLRPPRKRREISYTMSFRGGPEIVNVDKWFQLTQIPSRGKKSMHLYWPTITERIETGVARRVKLEPMGVLRQW